MNGKVVVVTGALGALGKVVTEEAFSRGAAVAGIDHAASQTPATPQRIEIGGVDLTDAAQAKQAMDAAATHFGRLDVLINIAGGFAFAFAIGLDSAYQMQAALGAGGRNIQQPGGFIGAALLLQPLQVIIDAGQAIALVLGPPWCGNKLAAGAFHQHFFP